MVVSLRFYSFYRLHYPLRGKLVLGFTPVFSSQCQKHYLPFENDSGKNQFNYNEKFHRMNILSTSFALCAVLGSYFLFKDKYTLAEFKTIIPGQIKSNLPTFTEYEVAKHTTKENGIWVIYKNGVYDVTEFVDKHPGGDKILMAAGSSIEPFWSLYAVHHTQEVYKLLEEHRIGNVEVEKDFEVNISDPYALDPKRHPILKPASVKPFNAEPPPSLLTENFFTPNEMFYVRNHLPVPQVDIKNYRLEIEGIGIKEKSLTLADIKKLPKHTITATVQCAGNRRSEMTKVKPVKGLNWGHAAIGTATWSGAYLLDVLKSCGLDLNEIKVKHVQFEGLDLGPDSAPYGASIPAEKAFDPKGDVLLAYEMNGEPLPKDHGFPLRVIVPGVVGARNVKWLARIVLSDKESNSHWQQNDYKGFSPSTDWHNVDFKTAPAIQELPVISAICTPEDGKNVEVVDGSFVCKGYAWSGGGKKIIRVDVSTDQGKSWHVAELEQIKDNPPRHWAWTLWSVVLPVPENAKTVEIWAKAVDSSYNTQPESFENIWNLRGVLSNAYHRVTVNVVR